MEWLWPHECHETLQEQCCKPSEGKARKQHRGHSDKGEKADTVEAGGTAGLTMKLSRSRQVGDGEDGVKGRVHLGIENSLLQNFLWNHQGSYSPEGCH